MLILDGFYRFHKDEEGQGLVEYVLIMALVGFSASAGMLSVASGINSAFTKIGAVFGQYIK